MDWTNIPALIANLGFPIVMCIAFVWYIVKRDEAHRDEVDSLRASYDEQTEKYCIKMDEVKEALNANTLVMTKLLERLENKV